MTIDTSGPTCSEPFALYDPDSSCWRTSQGTFPWASDEYSETWPRAGTWDRGAAYERPTSAPPTDASVCSSLPTPTAKLGKSGMDYRVRSNGPDLLGALLPTPNAGQHNYDEDPQSWLQRRERLKETANNGNGAGMPLAVAVKLLPTPTVVDAKGGRNSTANRRPDSTGNPGDTLSDVAYRWAGRSASTSRLSTDGPPSWEDQPLPGWTGDGSTPGSSSG